MRMLEKELTSYPHIKEQEHGTQLPDSELSHPIPTRDGHDWFKVMEDPTFLHLLQTLI